MSIKDLFNSQGTPKIQKSVTSDEMVSVVESSEYVEAKKQQFAKFIPPIDFASPSNFAKFGSAELYYQKAFERIHNYYPYDGTLHEKVQFENSSSYLDKYVFDNLYPRTNGYVNFDSSAYISVFGGPHTASSGMIGETLESTFDLSSKYDEDKNRTSAFEFRGDDGVTIEFWLKKSSAISAGETIFESTNSDGGSMSLVINSSPSCLRMQMKSGSATVTKNLESLTVSNDSTWHHYAISISSGSGGISFDTYKNGKFEGTVNNASPTNIPSILPTTSGLNATLGRQSSILTPRANLSASLDEFRFWKTTRTPEEIGRSWFVPVGGGVNSYDSNLGLSCYLKFNEGITGNSSLDSAVLDYSGRMNNGVVTNYTSNFRNTGSAITEKLSEPEFQDPIIYSTHPDVVSKKAEYMSSGSLADLENSSLLFGYFPAWMQEEDEQNGKQLKYLSQVMGSYFDTLWHQINFLNRVHDNQYISGSNKPLPFAKKLLSEKGFVMPDLFVDASITENLLKKDDNEVYEKEIDEVRNTIYHNLYSNLETIYKTKGTEKSFRNFFRSLGIGSEVVKLRKYADDSTFVLRDNYELKSFERKFLNFNYEGQFDGTIYQTSSTNNSNIYIPGDTTYSGSFTVETEIILPRKPKSNEVGFLPFSSVTASVFGFHSSEDNINNDTLALHSPDGPRGPQFVEGAISSYPTTGDKSISFWFKSTTEDMTETRQLVKFQQTKGGVDSLQIDINSGRFRFYATNQASTQKGWYWNIDSGSFYNNWKHVAFIWDGDFSSEPQFTIDAVSQGSPDVTTGSPTDATMLSTGYLSVLDSPSNTPLYEAKGAIMNLGVWSSNIYDEIESIYNNGVVPLSEPIDQENLLDYWQLGEGLSGFSAGDLIPDGTIFSSSYGIGNSLSASFGGNTSELALIQGVPTQIPRIYTHPSPDYDLSVYVVKNSTDSELNPDDSHTIRFMVTGAFGEITSSEYPYQYEGNKWNLAVRVRHENYPFANITGNVPNNYVLELYGVEADGYTNKNSFLVTSSISSTYFSSDKIFYAGAHRENFTGSSVYETDVKLGYLRYWHSYLSDGAINQHAYDPETFGANEPFENDLVNTYPFELAREKTLALHWAFADLTGSDSSGEMSISDSSSGSADSSYGSLSDTIQRYNAGRAIGFNASSPRTLDKTYLQTARKRLPDDLISSDLTNIKTEETEQFFVDDDVSDNFYSFEKSMWGTISDEMMNMFSTALDFNNLIGQPNQKYHHRYVVADFLRDRFFDDVENEPDIEKFTSFYKWIDDSISTALRQLVPASTRFADTIINVVESHVLERSKYVHQVPILTSFQSTEGSIKGITEMKYDWQYGHAPVLQADRDNEANHVLWQKDRKERDGVRQILRDARSNHSVQSSGLVRKEYGGSTYIGQAYSSRKFAKLYDIEMVQQNTIHGGTNFSRAKNLLLFHQSVAPAGALGPISGVPQNVITVGVGAGQGVVAEIPSNDNQERKKKYNFQAVVGNRAGEEYGHELDADVILPLNIMSGTVNSGFNARVESLYKSGVHFANLHNDTVGNYNEVSVQGPFTEQHVGGLQYRHIDINHGTDTPSTRPEGWGLVLRDHPVNGPDADGALGFIGADYETPYPSSTALKATRYREEHAKRPLNVRNIKTVSGSWKVGNYSHELQLFQLDSVSQRRWLREAYYDSGVDIIPSVYSSSLPDTTNYQTLIGIYAGAEGNIFGGANNRQDAGSISYYPTGTPHLAVHAPSTTTIDRVWLQNTSTSGYSTTGYKSISFWYKQPAALVAQAGHNFIAHMQNSGYSSTIQIHFNDITEELIFTFFDTSGGGAYVRYFISSYLGSWNSYVLVWDGVFNNSPTLYINGSEVSPSVPWGGSGTNALRAIEKITLLDYNSNNSSYEAQAAMSHFGIWEDDLTNYVQDIYNHGAVRDEPVLTGSLIDFWYLGKNQPGVSSGDAVPQGRIFSSSFGSAANHVAAYVGSDTGLIFAEGPPTLTAIPNYSNIIASPRTDLTGSERIIHTRFSAPGGPEVQSIGYLDAYTQTYSAHNAMPFRNLSVLGSGSGEAGTIRVEDHFGLRRGLRTLRTLHQGKFGLDSQYGTITVDEYSPSGSFNKQHRNNYSVKLGHYESNDDSSIRFPSSSAGESAIKTAAGSYDATTFLTSSGVSFSFWVNFDSVGDLSIVGEYQNLFVAEPSNPSLTNALGFGLYNSSNRRYFYFRAKPNGVGYKRWNWRWNGVSTGVWYHVFIDWSQDFAEEPVLYIDNELKTEAGLFGGPTNSGTQITEVDRVIIGGGRDDGLDDGYPAQARLSHFAIWGGASWGSLSDTATVLYNNGSPSPNITQNPSDLIDFWLLGNETDLDSIREQGFSTLLDSTEILSVSGNLTPISSSTPHLASIATGVNYNDRILIIDGTDEKYDNMHINTPIPRSELQYSWINAVVSGSDAPEQPILGYAPNRDGLVSSSAGWVEAIAFPSASTIYSV